MFCRISHFCIIVNYDLLNSFSSWANVLRAATNKQKKNIEKNIRKQT